MGRARFSPILLRLHFPLLILTALLMALWLDARLSPGPPDLPGGWEIVGDGAIGRPGVLDLPPEAQLRFNGLSNYSGGPFEIQLSLQVAEFGKLAVGVGSDGRCDQFEIETNLEFSGRAQPPSRINLVQGNDGYVMYYEDGNPIRRLARNLEGAGCFTLKTLDSKLKVRDFRVAGSAGSLHESFLVMRSPSRSFPLIAVVALFLILGSGVYEARIDRAGSARWAFFFAFPTAIFCAGALALEGAELFACLFTIGFLFSKLCFLFLRDPYFEADRKKPRMGGLLVSTLLFLAGFAPGLYLTITKGRQDLAAIPFLFVLFALFIFVALRFLKRRKMVFDFANRSAAAMTPVAPLMGVSLLLPEGDGGVVRAYAFSGLFLGFMCMAWQRRRALPAFNIRMLALFFCMFAAAEISLQASGMSGELSAMNLNETFKRHDLLLWVPMDFFSEDTTYQVQQYTIPRINFRSGQAAPDKASGTYRIVVMGGSNTWGDGIDDPQKTFPAVMEQRLNQEKGTHRFEVINAGVKGYASLQILVLLKHYIVDYNPDMVVFYILRNDLVQNWGVYTMREMYEMATSKSLSLVVALQRLLGKSVLYNAASGELVDFRNQVATGTGSKMKLKAVKTDEDFILNLRDMVSVCRSRGIQPVFVVEYQSADEALGYPYRQTELEKFMLEQAQELKVPILNANKYFYTQVDWHNTVLPHDLVHLNIEGHRQVGNYIVDFLEARKLLPPGD